jgi:ribosomal protein S12 methylthiotransferase
MNDRHIKKNKDGSKQLCKIGILSLGCPRNLVDSESILGRLNLKGYPVVDLSQAEVAIVNTCAFIEDAKRESIDAILDLIDLKKRGKLKRIIVYGCLTQRYKEGLLRELPEIDAFVGKVSLNHDLKGFSITPSHFAYLKICEGCINNCSYCIIPKIKGKFLSLDVNSVLKRAERFNKDRISELNIIGQDITGYGIDLYGAAKLDELLKGISRIASQIGWIRLLYLYPSRITDRLLELIRDDPKVCKYLDLPIQHINDRILNLMHRQTSKKDILNLIDKVRKTIPGVAIRTSLIVGFPSETDREFKELLGFIEDVRFERMGAFIYSREEGTEAFCFKKQIPQKIKVERFNALMSSQQGISREINQRFLGRIIDVLIDDRHKGTYVGRSQYDAPEVDGVVYVKSIRTLRPGEFVKVKVTDTLEYDLVGEAF